MKLTIDRKTWRRGGIERMHEDGGTALLNDKGKMCCLGFASIACGLEPKDILNVSVPSQLAKGMMKTTTFPECMAFLVQSTDPNDEYAWYDNSMVATELIRINDDHRITDKVREKQLTATFATVGWDVEFIN